jgi:D-alanyl-D-alanine carboxypeptidase
MDRRGILRLPASLGRLTAVLVGVTLGLLTVPLRSAHAQIGSARYSAIVVDAGTGRVIMGVNQDALRFPASLTKLMTLYMTFEALRDRRIQLYQYMTVSGNAAAMPPTKLGLQPGEALTIEQAILGLVTKSANDAAAVLGEFLGGSEDRFAQMMTLRARALGMTRTSFRNASGLPDSDQWTTARDLAVLGRRIILDFPQLYGYFSVPGFVFHGRVVLNHDNMLRTYPGADGMKTGFTDAAGHNLVTSAMHGNVRLIGVVMGAASNFERDQHMTMLLDTGFNTEGAPAVARPVGGLISVANAATTFSVRSAEQGDDAERPMPSPRVNRDRGIETRSVVRESAAREIAQAFARLVPDGQPRVQPVNVGRRTLYHAQLLGLSESEARTACATLGRRGAGCQVIRVGSGSLAQR